MNPYCTPAWTQSKTPRAAWSVCPARSAWLACAALILLAAPALAQHHSELWGEAGEKWTPASRLPDFSFAGYRFGEEEIPTPEVAANVRDFGARGDGEHDDTQAFLDAIEATESGAIFIPEGRYRITDMVRIRKPNLVLRGAGPEKSILFFPTPLSEIRPNPGRTTSGRPTSNYSWSGGLVWISGSIRMNRIAPIAREAKRGDRTIEVESPPADLAAGERVVVELKDDKDQSLLDFLYAGEPGDTRKITKPVTVRFVSRVREVDGSRITLERPLRYDVNLSWKPTLRRFEPTVHDSGIEAIGIEFPETPYRGHFTEVGYNGAAISGASDCWIRNVRITNADSGMFVSGMFCTVEGVTIESSRRRSRNTTGHHGISLGTDCLLTNFDLRTRFIHDITLGYLRTGNVIKNGKGVDLSLDHHKKAPHENLFCNIDLGVGSRMWRCGGGASLGKHCGARGTFWGVRAERNQTWPRANFGPDAMNLVGVRTNEKSITDPDGRWFEAISPGDLEPIDLHQAQLDRRLNDRANAASGDPDEPNAKR